MFPDWIENYIDKYMQMCGDYSNDKYYPIKSKFIFMYFMTEGHTSYEWFIKNTTAIMGKLKHLVNLRMFFALLYHHFYYLFVLYFGKRNKNKKDFFVEKKIKWPIISLLYNNKEGFSFWFVFFGLQNNNLYKSSKELRV